MSNEKKLGAGLLGYLGPFFPPCIEKLQHAFYGKRLNFSGSILEDLGRGIPGFIGISRAITTDDYAWFWSMNFKTGNDSKIAVLLPWGQDFDRTSGTSADRHIALYVDYVNYENAVENIIHQILAVHAAWVDRVLLASKA
ncbi:hypothetical protein A3A36_00245 [Candidatus Kaiserbacteria bacterium RIFCSPLOWO2_01_FULL_52_12b]|uniref:Uncharacterized protein n=1 Tax=Candidatus Kaiserbacteria bacterium RIFCSPLOWO2_01_FULL_52_12b TaxID=1798509 RepID=A0A1F6EY80_9BACT|nr:MAG: hypothetical protein A3A36_00245 [Candidatus Kaiserbacteria bacterium RIFCSPLOWO2_01_FULL_52_12b]